MVCNVALLNDVLKMHELFRKSFAFDNGSTLLSKKSGSFVILKIFLTLYSHVSFKKSMKLPAIMLVPEKFKFNPHLSKCFSSMLS